MRKKIISLTLAASMLAGIFGNIPYTAQAAQGETVFNAEDTVSTNYAPADDGFDKEAAIEKESAAKALSALSAPSFEDGKSDRLIVETGPGSFDTSVFETDAFVQDGSLYYVQYDSVEDAEEALDALSKKKNVTAEYDQEMIVSDDGFVAESAGSSESTEAEFSQSNEGESKETQPEFSAESAPESESESAENTEEERVFLHETATVDGKKIAAVIDTGVPSSLADEQYFVINESEKDVFEEDGSDRNGHGTNTATIIRNLSENAHILSIKAFDKEGHGALSSVIMAMRLAEAEDADVINISANTTVPSASQIFSDVVRSMTEEKESLRIVASAGNNGSEETYLPEGTDDITIAASCDEDGVMTETTNYGKVDYYVVSDNTSEAAATISGYLAGGKEMGDEVRTEADKFEKEEAPEESESTESDSESEEEIPAAPAKGIRKAPAADPENPTITVDFWNQPNSVTVIKENILNNEVLANAEITFTAPNGTTTRKLTGSDGKALMRGLRPGTWHWKETSAPNGYQIDNADHTFTVNKDGTINGKQDETFYVYNLPENPLHVNIPIMKQDPYGTPLEGVVFAFRIDGGAETRVTTNNIGWATSPDISASGTHTVTYQEVSVPTDSGIALDTTVYTVTISDGKVSGDILAQVVTDQVNSIRFRKTDASGRDLEKAVFAVTSPDGTVTNLVTGSDGYTDPMKQMSSGTYTYQEISAPSGYIADNTQHTFTVDEDGRISGENVSGSGTATATVTIINEKNRYTIKKVDADTGNAVPGVTFHIWSENKSYFDEGKTYVERETDESGNIVLEGLSPDTYYFQEQPFDGYAIDTTTHSFTVNSDGKIDGDTSVTIENTKNAFNLKKVDEDGDALSGVTFAFTYSGSGTRPFADGKTYTTDGNGSISFTGLPAGTYTFRETAPKDSSWVVNGTASDPYTKDGRVYTFTVLSDGTVTTTDASLKTDGNNTPSLTITMENEKHPAFRVKITKVDSSDHSSLDGAEFVLYSLDGTEEGKSYNLTDAGDGTYTAENVQITNDNRGHFRLIETKAPDGYAVDPAYAAPNGYEVVVTDDMAKGGNYTVGLLVENHEITAQFTKKDKEGTVLPDAVFSVWKEGDADHGSFETGYEVKSGSDGIVTLSRHTLGVPLSSGTWHYEEKSAPNGFDVDTNARTFVVTNEGINGDVNAVLPDFVNTPTREYPVRIRLAKKSTTSDEMLSGASFTVEEWNNTLNDGKGGWETATVLSQVLDEANEDYGYYTNNTELRITAENEGRFRVTETTAPLGYSTIFSDAAKNSSDDSGTGKIGEVWVCEFKAEKQSDDASEGNDQSASVTLIKDLVCRDTPNELRVFKADQNGAALAGAEFTLTRQADTGEYIRNGERQTTFTATSGRDGYAVFQNIPEGTYTLTETKAPDGYVRSDKITNLVVDADGYINKMGEMTRENPKVLNSAADRYVNTGNELTIVKVDGDNDLARLSGVQFSLWYEDNIRSAETVTTGADGTYTKTGLKACTWHFQETRDKDGKDVSATSQIYSVTVDSDGKITRNAFEEGGHETSYTVLNGASQEGSVRIRKIKAGTEGDAANKDNWITDAKFAIQEYDPQAQTFTDTDDYVFRWNEDSGYYELKKRVQTGTETVPGEVDEDETVEMPVYRYDDTKIPWTQANAGLYRVYEISSGEYYEANDWYAIIDLSKKLDWTFDLAKDGEGKTIMGDDSSEGVVTNEKNHLTIEKYDEATKKPVPGFGFTLTNRSVPDDVIQVRTDENGKAQLLVGGEMQGENSTNGVLRNGMIYYIKEDPSISTPEAVRGYHFEEEPGTLYVAEDGSINGSFNYTYRAYDYEKAAKLVIKKQDTEKDANIAGIEFEVYQWNTYLKNGEGDWEETPYQEPYYVDNEKKLRDITWTYDEETGEYTAGWFKYSQTNQGRFRVREVKNSAGYTGSWTEDIQIDVNGDADQTFSFTDENKNPAYNEPMGILHTGAFDNTTDSQVQVPDDEAGIKDRVYFHNLDTGRTYVIKGWIMDQDTGEVYKDSKGNACTSYVTFTINEDGSDLTVNASDGLSYNLKGGETDETLTRGAYTYRNGEIVDGLTYQKGENYELGIFKDRTFSEDEDAFTKDKIRKTNEKSEIDKDKDSFGNITPYGVVDGWIDLPFYMDSSDQGGTNIVLFEEMYSAERTYTYDGKAVYETPEDLILQSEHKDLEDNDQTINIIVPELHTTLADTTTGEREETKHAEGISEDEKPGTWDHNGKISEQNILRDTVGVLGLSGKNTYLLEASLRYKKDYVDADGNEHKAGEIVKDKNGKEVHVTKMQVWDPESGERYSGDYTDANGNTASVLPVTKRIDKTEDSATGVTFMAAEGTLVQKNGERLDAAGNVQDHVIKRQLNYVNIEFDLNSTNLEDAQVVAFETLYVVRSNGNLVKLTTHNRLEDADESIYYQSVHTNAKSKETDTEVGKREGKDILWDTVTVKGLRIGPTVMEPETDDKGNAIFVDGTEGTLFDKATGEAIPGTSIKIRTEDAEDYDSYTSFPKVNVTERQTYRYQLHATLMSKTLSLADGQKVFINGKSVETRVDFAIDSNGNITIAGTSSDTAPEIVSASVHSSDIICSINDRDEDGNIYKVRNEETGKEIPAKKVAAVYLPETVDLVIRVPLEIEDVQYLEGMHTVVFEDLLHKSDTYAKENTLPEHDKNGHVVAYHHDINDRGQSIFFPMFAQLFTGGRGIAGILVCGIGGLTAVGIFGCRYKKRKKVAKNRKKE